ELRTFRKDCGSYVRLYDFVSQGVDYGTSDREKLAEFLRQLVRLLPTDGADPDVDVSGLELRRVRQINQGRVDIAMLGDQETPSLQGITGLGSRVSRQDPQQALLSEVVSRINELFGAEFADPQIEGFVRAAAGMAEEDPRIAEQIDHNALDQFMSSPDLRETLTDAAVLNGGAFGKRTGALTGESERADDYIRLIWQYMYQSRRLRMDDEGSTDGQAVDCSELSRGAPVAGGWLGVDVEVVDAPWAVRPRRLRWRKRRWICHEGLGEVVSFVERVGTIDVAVHGVRKAKVTEGSRVLITGAGPIGVLNAQVARAHGASEIVISDPVENLRRFAEAHGASRAVDPMQTDFAQFEEHFDCYIDASGNA